MTEPTALYRHFAADGRLLYVGITRSAAARLAQHANSEWDRQIARIEVETLPTRQEAEAAERAAIRAECPAFNSTFSRLRPKRIHRDQEESMRAAIRGLRYDTATADLIGDEVTCPGQWTAGLYRTPRVGRYFLAGRGGPMSIFARASDSPSGWEGGQRIIPLTPDVARLWAIEYLPAGVVEQHFADQIEEA